MRFRRSMKVERGELGTIDIAPMIDVVFQLLIFFMLTSSFVFQPGIKINLPKAVTSEIVGKQTSVITITEENVIYFEKKAVNMDELKAQLQMSSSSDKPVLIRADKRAYIGRIVEVWDLCRTLGISQVNVATNQTVDY